MSTSIPHEGDAAYQDDRRPEPEDWPPPLVQGESQALPGFADVAERPQERQSWTG